LQNPYLRPRTTIVSEVKAASPHNTDETPPQARFAQHPDMPQRDSEGNPAISPTISSPAIIPPLPDRVAPVPPMQERRARLSSAHGFAAHAETLPDRKDDASQNPDVTPPSTYPLPPSAHVAALVRSTPAAQPEGVPSPPSLPPALRERPSPQVKENRPSPPKKERDTKEKGQKSVQRPRPPERTRSTRITKAHENVRITTPDSVIRDGVLSAKSRTGQRDPDVRVSYGTRSSVGMVDGPRIIRLR